MSLLRKARARVGKPTHPVGPAELRRTLAPEVADYCDDGGPAAWSAVVVVGAGVVVAVFALLLAVLAG